MQSWIPTPSQTGIPKDACRLRGSELPRQFGAGKGKEENGVLECPLPGPQLTPLGFGSRLRAGSPLFHHLRNAHHMQALSATVLKEGSDRVKAAAD